MADLYCVYCGNPDCSGTTCPMRIPYASQRRSDAVRKAVLGDTITATLDERGKRYGPFTGHAAITQLLKGNMHAHPGWSSLEPDQKEALEMIAHKVGRILNGDPNYDDSWVDIAGYAKLVADRLQGVQR